MPSKVFEDDNKNQSSFRVVWVPFMWALIIFGAFLGGLYLREVMSNGENVEDFLAGLKLTGQTGLGGFLLAALRKWIEGLQRANKPVTEPEKPSQPVTPPPPPTPPAAPEPEPLPQHDVVVDRIYETDIKTLANAGVWSGSGYVYNFKTIELPWKGNQREISRIPAGLYPAVAVKRNKDGKYAIQLLDVPGRSYIQFHIANYVRQLLGCFAPGTSFKDIDNDGILDVTSSKVVMDKLQEYFPLGTTLRVWVRDQFDTTGNIKPT